jgi:hypothetical protein
MWRIALLLLSWAYAAALCSAASDSSLNDASPLATLDQALNGLPEPRTIGIGQVLHESDEGSWIKVEGKVTRTWEERDGTGIELSVGSSALKAIVRGEPGEWRAMEGSDISVTGFCYSAFNSAGQRVPDRIIVPSDSLVEIIQELPARNTEANQRVLTTAVEVHQLKRGDAEKAIPARVRGVVTSTDLRYGGFTIQDATGGLYI